MNTDILLRLLVAHIIADFFLQTDKLCKMKKARPIIGLPLHSLIHAICSYIIIAEWANIMIPSVIFISHLSIDWVKLRYTKEGVKGFIFDQALHLAVILALSFNKTITTPTSLLVAINQILKPQNILLLCGYLLMLKPSSIFLSLLLKQWNVKIKNQSLPNAGKWIGYLERILILTFVLTNNFEGIGFLLAAKSVFRFGDLNKANDIRVTEYVLIGTLTSFTIATMVGLIIKQLIFL